MEQQFIFEPPRPSMRVFGACGWTIAEARAKVLPLATPEEAEALAYVKDAMLTHPRPEDRYRVIPLCNDAVVIDGVKVEVRHTAQAECELARVRATLAA